ncbi:MAG TPA: response regulator [Chloroflexota bacterium]|nr:response regulator [Chloroflexota bacterium]
MHVLVVTEESPLVHALTEALTPLGALVGTAADGLSALYALSAPDGELPDAVVLDLRVGGVSGDRLYELLRRDPLTRDIPVVALSSETVHSHAWRERGVPPPETFHHVSVDARDVAHDLLRLAAVPAAPAAHAAAGEVVFPESIKVVVPAA